MLYRQQTIAARATPPGTGAIHIVRISGPDTAQVLAALMPGKAEISQTHTLKLRKLYAGNKLIDEALVAVFKAPESFTGEDAAELYLHGSEFITNQIMQELISLGVRLADPGEFTMRAYLNGKLDLAQAEAVADLIAAQSEGSHKLAMNQLKGGISAKISEMRSSLLEFAALIELELDFGEEDVEFANREKLLEMLMHLLNEVEMLLASFKSGNAIRDGIPVAIVGRPNAGKSTLLNVILNEERAIVTDIPGTTRDTIEEYFVHEGLRYRLIDTAGIRDATDKVEAIGIERTFKSAEKAALIWLVFDVQDDASEIQETLVKLRQNGEAEIWLLANKSDLTTNKNQNNFTEKTIYISAKNNELGNLFEHLSTYGKSILAEASDTTISNLRHYEVLKNAKTELQKVVKAIHQKDTSDLLAFDLRQAMTELGKITGVIDTEDILGEIFSKFCIGK
ncbi:MAG: tRNA uridine-5-carboxymethylaminomethyl(34) synthesis GTPase MnmE [Bacteroidetes bacterium]|nr:tRNA uridine-5-carboxymethylaminomethyl(34) synthesis GTPase MnmE [Bacteroidota bacterium]